MPSKTELLNLKTTPWKINMESTNQPFRKENDLPNLHGGPPLFKEHGRFEQCTSQDMAELQIKVLPHLPFQGTTVDGTGGTFLNIKKYVYIYILVLFNSLVFLATVKLLDMHI